MSWPTSWRLSRSPRLSVHNTSIELRLLALTLGMLGLLLLTTIAATLFGLSQFEQRVSAARLAEEHTLIAQSLRNQQVSLMATALTLASDPSLIDAVRTGDRALSQRVLIPLQVRYQLDHLKLAGLAGQALIQTGPTPDETQTALRRALLSIEQSLIGRAPEGALIIAAVPIRADDGIKGALVVGQLLDDRLLRTLNFQRADPILTLHSADGRPMASSAAVDVLADGFGAYDAAFWQRALGEVQIDALTLADGTRYRTLYAPLNPDEATGMLYSVTLSTSAIQSFRRAIIGQNVIVLGLLALIGGLVIVSLTRRLIVRPLNELGVAAAKIGAGDLEVDLATERADEIGRLSNSFGAMADRLRRSFAALDARNQDLEQERAQIEQARVQLQDEVFQAQRTILQMTMPLIPIDRQTIIMPMLGALDAARAERMLDTLLSGVEASRARTAIIDITGVPVVDLQVARLLLQAVQGVRLLGARVIITGIQPEVAQSIVGVGVELDALQTYGTLDQAISAARTPRGAGR
jgi:anti-anti-sigma regulatory factor/HAMP domain-containing protein